MFDRLTSALDYQTKALALRAERQRVIASNIANADTPGYAARDINFQQAMRQALEGQGGSSSLARASGPTNARHLPIAAGGSSSDDRLGYEMQIQPSMDGNSVDLDQERGKFVDNSIRYESTLRFINGYSRTILSAITGQ